MVLAYRAILCAIVLLTVALGASISLFIIKKTKALAITASCLTVLLALAFFVYFKTNIQEKVAISESNTKLVENYDIMYFYIKSARKMPPFKVAYELPKSS